MPLSDSSMKKQFIRPMNTFFLSNWICLGFFGHSISLVWVVGNLVLGARVKSPGTASTEDSFWSGLVVVVNKTNVP